MFHAADHTMSNVMATVGLWEEEFARLNRIRISKGVGNLEWASMRHEAEAGHSEDTPFLKLLAGMVGG